MDKSSRSGRGRGRGRYDGRNYDGSGRFNKGNRSAKPYQFTKFAPQVEGKPPPPTFASVKDAIVLYFKRTKQIDVAVSIDKMALVTINKPTRPISSNKDPELKKEEQRGFDIDYKGELDEWRIRTKSLNEGMVSAYATIMSDYCTKLMRDRIEEHQNSKRRS